MIIGELLNAGIAITAPVFMQYLPQQVQETLAQKKSEEELSGEEYQALLETVVHRSNSGMGGSSQKMEVKIDDVD